MAKSVVKTYSGSETPKFDKSAQPTPKAPSRGEHLKNTGQGCGNKKKYGR